MRSWRPDASDTFLVECVPRAVTCSDGRLLRLVTGNGMHARTHVEPLEGNVSCASVCRLSILQHTSC